MFKSHVNLFSYIIITIIIDKVKLCKIKFELKGKQ